MGRILAKKIKIGEELLFPRFSVESSYTLYVNISKKLIRRIYGSLLVTKRAGANYEEEDYFAYNNLDEAKKYLIKELNNEKKCMNKKMKEEYNKTLEKIKTFRFR